ncbi:MarR family transcriptional regulator [Amorphus sp. 3PC139-8]
MQLDAFLPYLLSVLSETVSQSLSRLYGERYGISIPEWRVLAILGPHGTMTATEIGAIGQMHKTKVSRAVAALVEKRFLERERNRADQREALLRLTDQGRTIYEEFVPSARAFNAALVDALSPSERAQLQSILERLTERARDLSRSISEDQF